VLEQESAGAGAQCVVDVLVKVVGGEDDDATRRFGDDRAGGFDPSMTGILMSMSTMSGRSSRLRVTACAPSLACPTTANPGWLDSSETRPARTSS